MADGTSTSELSILGGAVEPGELFSPSWMAAHTDYERFEAFVADAEAGPDDDQHDGWDRHVADATAFDDWEEMVSAALDAYREPSSQA